MRRQVETASKKCTACQISMCVQCARSSGIAKIAIAYLYENSISKKIRMSIADAGEWQGWKTSEREERRKRSEQLLRLRNFFIFREISFYKFLLLARRSSTCFVGCLLHLMPFHKYADSSICFKYNEHQLDPVFITIHQICKGSIKIEIYYSSKVIHVTLYAWRCDTCCPFMWYGCVRMVNEQITVALIVIIEWIISLVWASASVFSNQFNGFTSAKTIWIHQTHFNAMCIFSACKTPLMQEMIMEYA